MFRIAILVSVVWLDWWNAGSVMDWDMKAVVALELLCREAVEHASQHLRAPSHSQSLSCRQLTKAHELTVKLGLTRSRD